MRSHASSPSFGTFLVRRDLPGQHAVYALTELKCLEFHFRPHLTDHITRAPLKKPSAGA